MICLILLSAGHRNRLMTPPATAFIQRPYSHLPGFISWVLFMVFIIVRFANADFTGQEAAWKHGMQLIESKKIFEGIRLLDSLRTSGYDDPQFLSAYAQCVLRCFMPQITDSGRPVIQKTFPHFAFDTTAPLSLSWNVSKSGQRAYPSFQYKATFVYKKPFTLIFQEPVTRKMPQALLRFHELEPQTSVQSALIEQISNRQDSANCTVCIDLNDTKSPLMEYVGWRIQGVYDSISPQNDLQKYHALSLRCFRRDFFSINDDSYAAYIVFDRTLADLQNNSSHKRRSAAPDANRKIRFTVAVRSGIDIQVFTEAKLQSLLRSF
jgi:hypothetical protein